MELKKIGTIIEGQDGAIWNNLLFRFDHAGQCAVYDLEKMCSGDSTALCIFYLEKTELIKPHSNSVFFGKEYFSKEDEFPLLYTNVYNNYSSCEDRRLGVCCVYRIIRSGNNFEGKLVQTIEIGFVNNTNLWLSKDVEDVRPYGNFVCDIEKCIYHAFTMRNGTNDTKYISFRLPLITDGEFDETLGAKRVVLTEEDILDSFDLEYHRFIQGACFHEGKIYSLEGFGHDKENKPAIRIVNPETKTQEFFEHFGANGIETEPELIDFWNGKCYYADNPGALYMITEF